MTLAVSTMSQKVPSMDLSQQLDDDIAKVRAEIASLTQRRSLLAASILSSSKFQASLPSSKSQGAGPEATSSQEGLPEDTNPLVIQQIQHNKTNVHRLAFGITSFPFTDPSPETSDKPLIGIRFDIPSHTGKFDQAPYYIFCRQIDSDNSSPSSPSHSYLAVHHHTIPAYVPLQDLQDKFLPRPLTTAAENVRINSRDNHDEGYDSSVSSAGSDSGRTGRQYHGINKPATLDIGFKQDLHAFATVIYTLLKAQALRKSAIALLSSPLHQSLKSLEAVGVDCKIVRLIWHDGMVSRIKISEDGFMERAVVFGEAGRLRDVERLLITDKKGGKVDLMGLSNRLDEVMKRRGEQSDMRTTSAVASQQNTPMIDDRNGGYETE